MMDTTAIFKALSDENRLKIISMLSIEEICACHIIERLSITQPTLSHHMKILCECGLVQSTKKGIWMFYCINQEKIDEIILFFKEIKTEKPERKR